MFPLFWWTLTSIKPDYAIFDKDGINWFNFEPTLENYQVTVLGQSRLSEPSPRASLSAPPERAPTTRASP